MPLIDGISPDLSAVKYKERNKPSLPRVIVRETGLIFVLSLMVFFTINLPAYLLILKYQLNPRSIATTSPADGVFKPKELAIKAIYPDNTIVIPEIGVNAPIIWNVEDDDVPESLENGVVHLSSTGSPSENKNIFISGHSSNYWWNDGEYNTVFALLGELKEGGNIFITKDGLTYKYTVRTKTEIDKQDAGKYLNSEGEKLTLMTCIPVGTNLKRLIVEAKPSGL